MPKVLSYTPAWLSRPSPGYQLFAPRSENGATNGTSSDSVTRGAQRTIAYRGSEIFVAVGNEIRWTDLVMLSEQPRRTQRSKQGSHSSARQQNAHRILKVPGSGKIKSLVLSPTGDYMAICTAHTVHIAVVPDSSHLGVPDTTPLKMRTFQLGPTVHVLEKSPLASVLWHPLGVQGQCVITVTKEGAVRLWEIDRDDRSSFSEALLAISLEKLATAKTAADDMRTSIYSSGRAFSVDMPDLQVASASFGSRVGFDDNHFWPAMTLWIATTGGDIYALCPLLPQKWQAKPSGARASPPRAFVKAVAANAASKDVELTLSERIQVDTQSKWLAEIQDQLPIRSKEGSLGIEAYVYNRPSAKIPIIPKLQGPFALNPELDLDDDNEITDIFISPLHENGKDVEIEDDDEVDIDEDIIPGSLVCISTTSGTVHFCVDLAGIEGQWLPSRRSVRNVDDDEGEKKLMLIDSVVLPFAAGNQMSLLLTPDVRSSHAIYLTHPDGVFFLSIAEWIQKLLAEIEAAELEGSDLRLELILEGPRTLTNLLIKLPSTERNAPQMTSPIVLEDSDLGYFLLFAADNQPFAAALDIPDVELAADTKLLSWHEEEAHNVATAEPRLPYQPPHVFYRKSQLAQKYAELVPGRHKRAFEEEIRLSPAVLDTLTGLHRIVSFENNQLGSAVADLFRKCERLQEELKEQLYRTSELNQKIEHVVGGDPDNDTGFAGNMMVNGRVETARTRQKELSERFESIKQRLARAGGQQMSQVEQEYADEVKQLEQSVNPEVHDPNGADEYELPIWQRIREVERLKDDLRAGALDIAKSSDAGLLSSDTDDTASPIKQQRLRNVQDLIQRQTAMVESVQSRLSRMSMQSL